MMRPAHCLLWPVLALACGAEQQTGSPAGVPVPAPSAPDATDAVAKAPAMARVFRVHVVDGRNGAPVARARVLLWYDEASGNGTVLQTNDGGLASMPEPVGLPVRVLLAPNGYVDCRKASRSAPPSGYNLQAIAEHGANAENGCGQIAIKPEPGELILYVRPLRWYEGLNR